MMIAAVDHGQSEALGEHEVAATDLRDAFNAVSEPAFSCVRAFLNYEAGDGIQFQRLTFSGTGADGSVFEVRSDKLRPDTDVNLAAAAVARKLLDDRKPPLQPAGDPAP